MSRRYLTATREFNILFFLSQWSPLSWRHTGRRRKYGNSRIMCTSIDYVTFDHARLNRRSLWVNADINNNRVRKCAICYKTSGKLNVLCDQHARASMRARFTHWSEQSKFTWQSRSYDNFHVVPWIERNYCWRWIIFIRFIRAIWFGTHGNTFSFYAIQIACINGSV
jgi:hypothetical protein